MRLLILSRGPQLYSTQSLEQAALRRMHRVEIVDHTRCNLVITNGKPEIYVDATKLGHFDAVIPRIGASVTSAGAAVIQQFENLGMYTTARSKALLLARDKLKCLQKLTHMGIDVPISIFVNSADQVDQLIEHVLGLPVIIKLVQSTHGAGVVICETKQSAKSAIGAFVKLKERVLVQEFIKESNGQDLRAFVVANKVVAAMQRTAAAGEFRSNLHLGATAEEIKLTHQEQKLAIQAARIMGLSVAGVDILRSKRGPLLMEVNASPGLEGIETYTGIDIAGKIIEMIERRVRRNKASNHS
ncbi:MAG: 30S ribosomal protein S6--L-glutamate ligase [Saprospiraceae bacterium]